MSLVSKNNDAIKNHQFYFVVNLMLINFTYTILIVFNYEIQIMNTSASFQISVIILEINIYENQHIVTVIAIKKITDFFQKQIKTLSFINIDYPILSQINNDALSV